MTSTAVPGQRAAQRPMVAAMQSNAAIGRLANPPGILASEMSCEVNGEWWHLYYPEGRSLQHWRHEATGRTFAAYPGPLNTTDEEA
ncbi:hypothetical protein DY218_27300 [Streptomyces triticagri]|uniref:Uncharacterized protein n=1 Tax=Streptomyces triticagri TaxID=2293568 RepID=A0A372LY66_9ACTN|nr:hypothetical protein [Streptomyces triticagri]RFU83616.1 hypothetical protein DY218_27300 [Streptomyces triticagri]